MTAQASQVAASLDIPSLATNLVILCGFIAATIAGVWKGLKSIKSDKSPTPAPPEFGAVKILENATLNEWSGSNKEVALAIDRLTQVTAAHRETMESHKAALYVNRDNMVILQAEFAELRHQIERLRDALK